jgi:hypothetical protein
MSFIPIAGDLVKILKDNYPNAEFNLKDVAITYWSDAAAEPTQQWIDTKLAEYGETGRALVLLRIKRHTELSHSDWTRLDDNGLTEAKKEEWKTYRQTLRDLPSTADPKLDENGKLINVTWPTEPE